MIADNISISDREYKLIADLIFQKSGISLGDKKADLVKARLAKRMRFHQFGSYRDYYDYVMADISGDEIVAMLDAISTNVTSFFREKQHFDFLANQVLPGMIERKKKERSNKIRVWSAASSSGEEVYTLLMVLMDYLKDPLGWDIKVLGTDISKKALSAAQQGVYSFEKMKTVPFMSQDKYFDRIASDDGGHFFKVKEKIRRFAYFARLNLMEGDFPFRGKFDIIFCRNVMIYFDKETQVNLVNKFGRFLEKGGYLFIGHAESLIGTKTCFENVAPAVFQRIEDLRRK